MKKIRTTEEFRKEVYRLTRQVRKLNGYVQNINPVYKDRVGHELQEISKQSEYLLKQINPKLQEENVSKEE